LLQEFRRWLPEFDHILFDIPHQGSKSLAVRIAQGKHRLPASELSDGTLIALGLLTLAYLEDPPMVVCLEEPDRGLHPRLLRDVRDAVYRLAYPQQFGIARKPVQVIATTHSPYFLSLFKEHPEEVVIADKQALSTKFSRLSDRADLNEILGSTDLGEAWYTGVLGGVPAR
jgi:predicted ATPase